jgi:hypothetical protein
MVLLHIIPRLTPFILSMRGIFSGYMRVHMRKQVYKLRNWNTNDVFKEQNILQLLIRVSTQWQPALSCFFLLWPWHQSQLRILPMSSGLHRGRQIMLSCLIMTLQWLARNLRIVGALFIAAMEEQLHRMLIQSSSGDPQGRGEDFQRKPCHLVCYRQ